MTSDQRDPLISWATLMLQWPVQRVCEGVSRSQSHQSRPQFGLRAATRPHEAGIASNRGSAMPR